MLRRALLDGQRALHGFGGERVAEAALITDRHLYERLVTGSAAPCTARASSEARNTMTLARSAGATQRAGSTFGMSARFCGVSMMVGRTQLTLMFFSRSSADMVSVSRITALFEAM